MFVLHPHQPTYLFHLAHVRISRGRERAVQLNRVREPPVPQLGHAPSQEAGSRGNGEDAG